MLYSFMGQRPAPLPWRIRRLSDGYTRTDPSQFTEDDIADAGYVLAPDPPMYDAETQGLDWDGSSWSVVDLVKPPLAEA